MHYHLRQLFDAESAGRDDPGLAPRGLCAVGWSGAASPLLGRTVHYMTVILAVEPDPRQASRLSSVLRGRRNTEVVIARSADTAIESIAGRVPNVLLTSPLLSPQDEARLADWLQGAGAVRLARPGADDSDPRAEGRQGTAAARTAGEPAPPHAEPGTVRLRTEDVRRARRRLSGPGAHRTRSTSLCPDRSFLTQ